MAKRKAKRNMFQTVTLHLADGTQATYMGRAQIASSKDRMSIVGVEVTEPIPLAEGCKFAPMKEVMGHV